MQADHVVEARDLTFSYGSFQVLNGLSLSVRKGEVFGVPGANGSGRTTLMRLMVGLLHGDGGTLAIHGEPPSPRRAARVGYMPQLSALCQELSVRENVDFFARMYGMSERGARGRSVEATIDLVGLRDHAAGTDLTELWGDLAALAVLFGGAPGRRRGHVETLGRGGRLVPSEYTDACGIVRS